MDNLHTHSREDRCIAMTFVEVDEDDRIKDEKVLVFAVKMQKLKKIVKE